MAFFHTIGHSNRELDEFIDLLHEHDVQQVVDVRKLPGSRRHPQFNEDTLANALADEGITLTHSAGLTGRRTVNREIDDAVNAWWQNRSFHNYADHALSAEFGAALGDLRHLGANTTVAIMCSEAVWWRCHRRIIADYLVASGHSVHHIMGPGQIMEAELSQGAVTQQNQTIHYPKQ